MTKLKLRNINLRLRAKPQELLKTSTKTSAQCFVFNNPTKIVGYAFTGYPIPVFFFGRRLT